jgi:hypothetical protein
MFTGGTPIVDGIWRAEADYAQQAAAAGAFFAVAEQKVGVAGGTEAADVDVLGAETGFEELRAIGFAEVEPNLVGGWLVARRHHVEPLQGVGLVAGAEFVEELGGAGELRGEGCGDVGADFVAATANRRADGRQQILRAGAELHLHLADGFGDDALEGAAPSSMNGGDHALFGIHHKNRGAICGADAEKQALPIGG